MKSRYGLVFIALSFLFCIELFLLSKSGVPEVMRKPWLSFAQISGLLGVVSYALTSFLSSRIGFLEQMFGGLDTVYRIHQRMGRISFMLLSSHFIGLLLHYTNLPLMLTKLLLPSDNIAYTAGILSFGLSALFWLWWYLRDLNIRLLYASKHFSSYHLCWGLYILC